MNISEKKLIIAIDGHSSCGKSTVAKDLAKKLTIPISIVEQCIELLHFSQCETD